METNLYLTQVSGLGLVNISHLFTQRSPILGYSSQEGRLEFRFFAKNFSFSHHLSMVRHWPSSSLSTGCVVSLRGDWPFSATLARDGLAECDQLGKNPFIQPLFCQSGAVRM